MISIVDTHFRTPELLKIRRQFLENKIRETEASDKDDFLKSIDIFSYKDYLLQILSGEGSPIDEVEKYAAALYYLSCNVLQIRSRVSSGADRPVSGVLSAFRPAGTAGRRQ